MKNELDEIIASFVNKRLGDRIKEILTSNKNAIVLDFNDIDQFSPELGDFLLKNPEETLETIKYFVAETSIPHKGFEIEIRIKNLPKNSQMLVREIRSKHIGLFIQVQGLIKTAASVKPVASAIDFECQSCGHITKVEQKEMTQRAPSICTNCGKKGRFKIAKKYLVDTQRIMLEEAPEDLEGGEQPEHINVILKKDLVDPKFERSIIPGNKVVVSGIINESAIYYPSGKRSNTSDTFLLASYVEAVEQGYEDIVVTKEEELAIKELANDKMIYSKFKNSIAPNIFGHDNIKEAIVMQLFGGVRKAALSGNSVIRGDIHVLLVGDPGTSKSSLLKYVTGIAPKARYVVGMGSSAAGLTATIIKDEATRSYILEAGALPLTNKGLLMIDELDKMNKDDRVAMHEALEQQSYSYDSKVLLSDGSEIEIGKLVERYLSTNKDKITKGKDCEILDAKNLNIKLLTTDFNKIFETTAFQLSRHKAEGNLINIEFSERKLTVTPNHPVWIFKNGEIKTVPAEKLKKGMQIPIHSLFPVVRLDKRMQKMKTLKDLSFGDLTFKKIKKIREVRYENDFVYDIGVLPTHTLIVNGIVSHNSISISKANIHATLTAQTSVLAAANPKLGRFNPFDVISSQIELPPTLINRFDLIFILKDRPDKETDTLIAQRILEANRDINKNKPEIPPNIMKKYIAYAKQNIKPKMSMDAMKIIQEFYLKLRSQYSTEGEEVKPIPISARQLEAIVRLTEASAKVRLSEYATVEDAKRAIDLMMSYLGDVGIDSSTGELDIDRVITGISSSQRNTVLTVKSMIKSEIESMPMGSAVPLSKIYEDAEKAGIDSDRVDSAISVLKREGEIFEPKPSFIKLL